jgi:hypothetical protein
MYPNNRGVKGPCEIVSCLANERYQVREIVSGQVTEEAGNTLRYRL